MLTVATTIKVGNDHSRWNKSCVAARHAYIPHRRVVRLIHWKANAFGKRRAGKVLAASLCPKYLAHLLHEVRIWRCTVWQMILRSRPSRSRKRCLSWRVTTGWSCRLHIWSVVQSIVDTSETVFNQSIFDPFAPWVMIMQYQVAGLRQSGLFLRLPAYR